MKRTPSLSRSVSTSQSLQDLVPCPLRGLAWLYFKFVSLNHFESTLFYFEEISKSVLGLSRPKSKVVFSTRSRSIHLLLLGKSYSGVPARHLVLTGSCCNPLPGLICSKKIRTCFLKISFTKVDFFGVRVITFVRDIIMTCNLDVVLARASAEDLGYMASSVSQDKKVVLTFLGRF